MEHLRIWVSSASLAHFHVLRTQENSCWEKMIENQVFESESQIVRQKLYQKVGKSLQAEYYSRWQFC